MTYEIFDDNAEEKQNSLSELNESQRVLYSALSSIKPDFATYYYGSIKIWKDTTNPERYIYSAHGLRELMEKLPEHFTIEKHSNESPLEQIRTLSEIWSKCRQDSGISLSAPQTDSCVVPQQIVIALDNITSWYNAYSPSRKTSLLLFMQQVDHSGLAVPNNISEETCKQWSMIYRYFTAIAHHQPKDLNLFISNLNKLEVFLLDQLVPRPAEDLDEIDDIIQAGDA